MHIVESRSTRVLSTTDEEEQDQRTNLIRGVTDSLEEANDSNEHDTNSQPKNEVILTILYIAWILLIPSLNVYGLVFEFFFLTMLYHISLK